MTLRNPVNIFAAVAFGAASLAASQSGAHQVKLEGYQEVPAISTSGSGRFEFKFDRRSGEIDFELSYKNLTGNILQSHIHFGQMGVNGGISVFLCSNLGNGPAGTALCPGTTDGKVSGTLTPDDVIGPGGQGIAAGEFDELVEAIKEGVAYVNVHTDVYPSGELRAQLEESRRW